MAGTGEIGARASDAERERAIAALKDGFADGRLSDESFMARVEAALTARAGGELRGLVADLTRRRRLPAGLRAAGLGAARLGSRLQRAAGRALAGHPPELILPPGPQPRYTIGREPWCDLTLRHESVSRWHASLQRDAGGCWLLADLGSTNGTRLNGWRVATPTLVRPGDLVSFGAATFVLADRRG